MSLHNINYNEKFMNSSPFTPQQIQNYNSYSWYDVDINKEFNNSIQNTLEKVNSHYPGERPEAVEIALYYYRKALYESYLADIRAKNKNPGSWFVGPSNYKGNPEKARKIEQNAMDKLNLAKEYLRKAINAGHKEEQKEVTKKENNIQVGDKIKVWWTGANTQFSGIAIIKKINVKTINIELIEVEEPYEVGQSWSIPIVCTKGNRWESLDNKSTPKTNKELQNECYDSLKGKFKVGERVYNTFYRFEGEIIKINKLTMVIKGEPTYERDDGLRKVPIDESMNKRIEEMV